MRAKQRWLQNIVYQVPLKAYEGIAKGPCAHWSPEKRQENGSKMQPVNITHFYSGFPAVCLGLRSHMKPKWPGDWHSLGLGRWPKIMGGGKLCTLPLTFQESSLECAGSKGLPQLLEVIPLDSSGPGRGQDGAMLGASWPMLGLVWTQVGLGWTQGGSCWPKLRPC